MSRRKSRAVKREAEVFAYVRYVLQSHECGKIRQNTCGMPVSRRITAHNVYNHAGDVNPSFVSKLKYKGGENHVTE